jgi:hypothetical protein
MKKIISYLTIGVFTYFSQQQICLGFKCLQEFTTIERLQKICQMPHDEAATKELHSKIMTVNADDIIQTAEYLRYLELQKLTPQQMRKELCQPASLEGQASPGQASTIPLACSKPPGPSHEDPIVSALKETVQEKKKKVEEIRKTLVTLEYDRFFYDLVNKAQTGQVEILAAHKCELINSNLDLLQGYKENAVPAYQEDLMLPCVRYKVLKPLQGRDAIVQATEGKALGNWSLPPIEHLSEVLPGHRLTDLTATGSKTVSRLNFVPVDPGVELIFGPINPLEKLEDTQQLFGLGGKTQLLRPRFKPEEFPELFKTGGYQAAQKRLKEAKQKIELARQEHHSPKAPTDLAKAQTELTEAEKEAKALELDLKEYDTILGLYRLHNPRPKEPKLTAEELKQAEDKIDEGGTVRKKYTQALNPPLTTKDPGLFVPVIQSSDHEVVNFLNNIWTIISKHQHAESEKEKIKELEIFLDSDPTNKVLANVKQKFEAAKSKKEIIAQRKKDLEAQLQRAKDSDKQRQRIQSELEKNHLEHLENEHTLEHTQCDFKLIKSHFTASDISKRVVTKLENFISSISSEHDHSSHGAQNLFQKSPGQPILPSITLRSSLRQLRLQAKQVPARYFQRAQRMHLAAAYFPHLVFSDPK